MSVTTHSPVVLEPASQAFVEATAKAPFLYEPSPVEARAVLDELQVILHMHGGGWVLGNAAGRLARGSGPRGTERRRRS